MGPPLRFTYSLGSFKSSIFETVIHTTAAADQAGKNKKPNVTATFNREIEWLLLRNDRYCKEKRHFWSTCFSDLMWKNSAHVCHFAASSWACFFSSGLWSSLLRRSYASWTCGVDVNGLVFWGKHVPPRHSFLFWAARHWGAPLPLAALLLACHWSDIPVASWRGDLLTHFFWEDLRE